MTERIIDLVNEEKDTESVREDWHFLVAPLAECIKLPVEKSPSELYINTTKKPYTDQTETDRYDNDEIIFLDEWQSRYDQMVLDTLLPKILIARIGIGKTSWLQRFMHHLKGLEKVYYYYYNHNSENGGPVGGQFNDPSQRLHCFLYANFLMILKEACSENNGTGLRILNYDENKAASSVEYIDLNMAKAFTEACDFLNKKNVKIFFIIDNLDEYSIDVQKKALGIADYIAKLAGIYPVIALRPETYHGTQAHLNNPRHHAITPALLNQMLSKRYEYLWEMGEKRQYKIFRISFII